jgi:hypothetical protein
MLEEPNAVTPSRGLPSDLPIKRDLALVYALSYLVALLMAAASAAGILFRTTVYPSEELLRTFVPNDVVNLLIGVPILLGSMGLARRGALVGLLCWPGALFFVLYNYLAYAFAMPLGWAFLVHLALATSSMYALVGLLSGIDGGGVKRRLAGALPERFAAGALVGLGLLFFLRVIVVVVDAVVRGVVVADAEFAVNVSDFLTTPAWVIGGLLLWRRAEFGYVVGLGLLFQGCMLFVALIVFLLIQPILTTAPFVLADVLVVAAMGLVLFVPFVLSVRGLVARGRR